MQRRTRKGLRDERIGGTSEREMAARRDMLQRGGDGARRVISDLNKLRYVPRISSSNDDDSNGDSRGARRWSLQATKGMRTRGVRNMNVIYLRCKGRKTGFPSAETTFELVHCLLLSPRSLKEEARERRVRGLRSTRGPRRVVVKGGTPLR